MVLCLLALPIFLVLGIFSVRYRQLTKDSLNCLFHTVTLRKCQSGLDDRIKSQITGHILKFSPRLASITYKNYKLLSWIFLILMIWSAYEGSIGTYNYILYGNCNGPESTGFCLLDPVGKHTGLSLLDTGIGNFSIMVDTNDPIIGNPDAPITIMEFGCYVCPYTKTAEPTIKQVLNEYSDKVKLQYKDVVIASHQFGYESALSARCANDQGKYEEYHNLLFENQEKLSNESFVEFAEQLNLDVDKFNECFNNQTYKQEVEADNAMAVQLGVTGTPTFIINEHRIVGPKPFRTFKTVIEGVLNNVSIELDEDTPGLSCS